MVQPIIVIFTRKIRERVNEREALIAAYALEGLFRLALEGDVSRHRPLLELSEITSDVPGLFAQHAAKIGGAAFHVWGGDDLLTMLHRLLDNDEAEGEAAFELVRATSRTYTHARNDNAHPLPEAERCFNELFSAHA